jgi:hypothetical protein
MTLTIPTPPLEEQLVPAAIVSRSNLERRIYLPGFAGYR